MLATPLVSVVMITYKHQEYIQQAVEGVLMQQCNFPVELIIADDNSPDATKTIVMQLINEHPNGNRIKYTKHPINKGMMPNFIWALQQCKTKYIALCEGDDYWTDPLKLQKQVDFLEENEEYGLVHTQTYFKHFNDSEIKLSLTDRRKNKFEDLIYKNNITTLTTCIRLDLVLTYIAEVKPQYKQWVAGDLPMWLWFSLNSKIYFLDEPTAVYRMLVGSASNTVGSAKYFEFIKSRLSIKEYFIKAYSKDQSLINYIYSDFYKDAEYHCLKLRNLESMTGAILNFKNKKSYAKYYYFKLMVKLIDFEKVYNFAFLFYRIYNKYFIKTKKRMI